MNIIYNHLKTVLDTYNLTNGLEHNRYISIDAPILLKESQLKTIRVILSIQFLSKKCLCKKKIIAFYNKDNYMLFENDIKSLLNQLKKQKILNSKFDRNTYNKHKLKEKNWVFKNLK